MFNFIFTSKITKKNGYVGIRLGGYKVKWEYCGEFRIKKLKTLKKVRFSMLFQNSILRFIEKLFSRLFVITQTLY